MAFKEAEHTTEKERTHHFVTGALLYYARISVRADVIAAVRADHLVLCQHRPTGLAVPVPCDGGSRPQPS